jgi:hypothetical protein
MSYSTLGGDLRLSKHTCWMTFTLFISLAYSSPPLYAACLAPAAVHVQYSPGLHAGLGALRSAPSSAYGGALGHGHLSITSLFSRLTKRSAWGPGNAGVLGSTTSGDPLPTVRALAISHAARITGFAMRIRTLDLAAGGPGALGHHSFMTTPPSPGASSLFSGPVSSFYSGSHSLMTQPSLVSRGLAWLGWVSHLSYTVGVACMWTCGMHQHISLLHP